MKFESFLRNKIFKVYKHIMFRSEFAHKPLIYALISTFYFPLIYALIIRGWGMGGSACPS
eukprot:UN24614